MVPRMMGPMAGGMIRDWCEHKGVHVRTGARVEAIVPGEAGQPLSVRLSTGEHLLTEPTVYQPGTDVVVAVRPEHVQPNAPRSSTTLTARLKMALPAGSNVHYEFSLSDGTALRVAVPRHGGTVGLAVGEDATLGVEPKRCRVFRIDPTEPRSS